MSDESKKDIIMFKSILRDQKILSIIEALINNVEVLNCNLQAYVKIMNIFIENQNGINQKLLQRIIVLENFIENNLTKIDLTREKKEVIN